MQTIEYLYSDPIVDTRSISVRGLGIHEVMTPQIVNRPMGTGDHLFMFFYDKVRVRVDGRVGWHPPQSFIAWAPEHGHYYGNPNNPWDHSWIHCDGSLVRKALAAAHIPLGKVTVLPDFTLPEKYLLEIHQELTDHARPDPCIVRNHLHNWIREVARMIRPHELGPPIPQKFLDLRRYLDANYSSPITLTELAGRVHLSVPYFCSEFKKHFGFSAINHVVHLRLDRAAHLLRNQNLRISEVASGVGYDDVYYFSRLFKKRFGKSPRAMRREMARIRPGGSDGR